MNIKCLFAADVRKVSSDGLICKHLFSEHVTYSFKRESKWSSLTFLPRHFVFLTAMNRSEYFCLSRGKVPNYIYVFVLSIAYYTPHCVSENFLHFFPRGFQILVARINLEITSPHMKLCEV